jgi:WD40 repeat protein
MWESIDLAGHSSHVTNVAFSAPDSDGGLVRLFSAGGNDKCLMQWRLTPVEDELAGRTDIGNL